MRQAKPSLRQSFFGWLESVSPSPAPDKARRVAAIRERMLREVMATSSAEGAFLVRRIATADDVQGLWYARADLMQAVGPVRGEARARELLAELTAMFDGLMPASVMASAGRPSRRH